MRFYLKELSLDMGYDVYLMYQDIPAKESGSTNKCFGLSFDEFFQFLVSQINRKNSPISDDDTPTTTYIMYVDEIPVGYICLRTKINDKWLKWSGNFYYAISKSHRNKGYASKMLSLGLDELRKLGFTYVYGQSSPNNIASSKVIENNGGILLYEENGTKYYKINCS